MSFGRKTYDGNFTGRHSGPAEWGDSVSSKSKVAKPSPPKRTAAHDELLNNYEEPLFSEDGEKDRYLITYADLITLLLGLFIILYAVSNIDAKKYQKMRTVMGDVFGKSTKVIEVTPQNVNTGIKAQTVTSTKMSLKSELEQIIDRYHYNKSIKLEENERGIVIHILDDILFTSGSADLTKSSLDVLNRLASILKELPNDIRIEGHTDNVPINTSSFPSNWHLSVARALNTAYYLIHDEGLIADKVSIVGYSEYKPIASNDTPEGRATNRRVDIVIIKK